MYLRSFKVTLVACAVTVSLSSIAEAGFTYGALNDVSFRDRSQAVDSTGTAATTLTVGDRFYGMFSSDSVLPAGVVTTPEITGIFDLTVEYVVARTADAGSGVAAGEIFAPGGANLGKLATYSGSALSMFRPTNTTGAEGILGSGPVTLADGTVYAGASLPAFSAFALYEGGPVDVLPGVGLDGFANQKLQLEAASDGTPLGAFGFSSFASPTDWGAPGNGYWFATATYGFGGVPGLVSPIAEFFYGMNGIPGSGSIVDSPFGVTPLFNPTLDTTPGTGLAAILDALTGSTVSANFALGPDDMIGDFGAGTNLYDLTGKGATSSNGFPPAGAFPLRSEDPAFLNPNVPEPGSMLLALIGTGCAAPFVRRRRRKAAEQTAV